jgi:hypothetical protein
VRAGHVVVVDVVVEPGYDPNTTRAMLGQSSMIADRK